MMSLGFWRKKTSLSWWFSGPGCEGVGPTFPNKIWTMEDQLEAIPQN